METFLVYLHYGAPIGALSTPGSAGRKNTWQMESGKSYSQVWVEINLASTGTQSAGDFFKNKALGMEPGFAKSGLGALEYFKLFNRC